MIERYSLGVKCYVPLALSNGIWVRTLGLPGLEGLREVCFFLFFCPPLEIGKAYRPQFQSYGDEILHAHYPWGDTSTFPTILGVGPPEGKFFPNCLLRYRQGCSPRELGLNLESTRDRFFCGLGLGLGLESCGLGLGLETFSLGLGLGLEGLVSDFFRNQL